MFCGSALHRESAKGEREQTGFTAAFLCSVRISTFLTSLLEICLAISTEQSLSVCVLSAMCQSFYLWD